MPDKDLRKQALKGGKTTSRKATAKSLHSSPASSRPASALGSRSASRVVSRDVSDDEDDRGGNLSDDTNLSITSIDALLEGDEIPEVNVDVLRQDLNSTIDEIVERKGSSTTGREDALTRYNRILMSHPFGDVLAGRIDGLLSALSKSIKTETSQQEAVLALRALSLTALSYENATLYETVGSLLKRVISDSQNNPSKAAAIECLGICLTFGGAGNAEAAETCTFLMEIIQSDGSFVGADDDAAVVTAAINTYSYLLTELDDVEQESEDSIEALMEQLDSGDVNVQIAAGEAIALLFEKSYSQREEEESDDEDDEVEEDSDSATFIDKSMVKRYSAYHNPSEVLDKVSNLANLSSRSHSKRDKRRIHQSFASVAITVEDPRAGLQTNNESRLTVKIHREGEIRLDKWWKLIRLNALRRVLLGGFVHHYFDGNRQVLNALPLLVQSTGMKSPRGKTRNGDKYRGKRRFLGVDD